MFSTSSIRTPKSLTFPSTTRATALFASLETNYISQYSLNSLILWRSALAQIFSSSRRIISSILKLWSLYSSSLSSKDAMAGSVFLYKSYRSLYLAYERKLAQIFWPSLADSFDSVSLRISISAWLFSSVFLRILSQTSLMEAVSFLVTFIYFSCSVSKWLNLRSNTYFSIFKESSSQISVSIFLNFSMTSVFRLNFFSISLVSSLYLSMRTTSFWCA